MYNSELDTQAYASGARLDHTPDSAVTGGDVVAIGGGIPGFADLDIAASDLGALAISGVRYATKGTDAFSAGDDVLWNTSDEEAVAPGSDTDASNLLYLGQAVADADSGDDYVLFQVPGFQAPKDRFLKIRPVVYEFNCGSEGSTAAVTLLPASANTDGLVFLGALGIVSETFGGDSEDQAVVTIYDGDDNALATLTPSDAGADAVGDGIVSTNNIWGLSTGDAVKTVAAGKSIYAKVTTQTSGSDNQGKMKVHLHLKPLV